MQLGEQRSWRGEPGGERPVRCPPLTAPLQAAGRASCRSGSGAIAAGLCTRRRPAPPPSLFHTGATSCAIEPLPAPKLLAPALRRRTYRVYTRRSRRHQQQRWLLWSDGHKVCTPRPLYSRDDVEKEKCPAVVYTPRAVGFVSTAHIVTLRSRRSDRTKLELLEHPQEAQPSSSTI
ncbi:hypothetical protein MRX96_047600 [Rhipicephalus microplus]